MYDPSRKLLAHANYQYPDYTIQYVNVEQPQQYYTPYYQEFDPNFYNPQLANIKPVKYYNKTQLSSRVPFINVQNNPPRSNRQFVVPLSTRIVKPINDERKDQSKGMFKNFCSFWTKSCSCDQKPESTRTNPKIASPTREILDKNNNNVKIVKNEPIQEQKVIETPINKTTIVMEKVKVDNPEPQPTQVVSLTDNKVNETSKLIGDIKPLITPTDVHVSLAEKLSNKLEQAQERILELEREKIILEQSVAAMKIEMEEYINCVKQSESVMDVQHNYSTAVLNAIIDFCCSLSTPNKHHEIRHAVRTFALDLFQLLVNNNAPNNHIAELISLNGILAETSYVDVLNTPKQLAPSTAKAVFKSSKPLSSIRPL